MVVGEFTQETDVVVIGGGPAGYTCAFRAAELGVKTLIVDAHPSGALGGICLHDGCIPSKTLLHVAELINGAAHAMALGVTYAKPHIDLDGVRSWKDSVVKRLVAGLDSLCRKHGVERLGGVAHFEDSRHVAIVGGNVPRVRFRRAVIATGSRPIEHDLLPFTEDAVWTPQQAVHIPGPGTAPGPGAGPGAGAGAGVPKRLLVIGCGYIAVELATIYAALGSDVTLVDEGERVLPDADADLMRPLDKHLGDVLEDITMGVRVKIAKFEKHGVRVSFEGDGAPGSGSGSGNDKGVKFDRVIVALGQHANINDLALTQTRTQLTDDGFIAVDEQVRTGDQRIYAVGDVTGAPLLADKAIRQGRVCGEVLAGWGSRYDARTVPMTVFTDPQLAWCGVTESEAKAQGIAHAVAKIPWGASGRAAGMGRSDGVTKIIFDPDTQLVLGVGICGPHACEMIAEGALAIEMGAVLHDLAATIHPHPTMSELISDAAKLHEQA
jgi:dihydrolipoamide dehydrogenase